ncbi:MAG: M28 family peptidase [Bacteroidota bacterium]|nr:M28 family peptidase [Bacteroidota bacterium]
MNKFTTVCCLLLFVVGCSSASKQSASADQTAQVAVPQFDSDSSFLYVKTQCNFGPRVPNSKAHDACADYLVSKMEAFGAKVIRQKADLKGYDGTILKSTNIIASYKPELKERILLCAHWDCRPWCDQDKDPANHHKPVMGANDAASGVGVLMEVARQLNKQQPAVGVDIIFLDSEDYGTPEFYQGVHDEDSWCLGTQYWAKNPHVKGYKARFGILLDMVGAPGAVFYKEQESLNFAPSVVDKVWNKAREYGYTSNFVDGTGGAITDDHIYVNRLAGIPCIDIIHFDPHSQTGFGSYWHTTHDTMDNVDKQTLLVVGQTLLGVIYGEK